MSTLTPHRGRLATVAGLALLLALSLPGTAGAAKCLITGPTLVCGSPISLCGPTTAHLQYEWTLPDGSQLTTSCISASAPGTYSLRVFDTINGIWSSVCTWNVTAGVAPPCSISGPTSACVGTPIDLCGPSGSFNFRWTGPNGFTDSVACIHVSVAGTYQLVVSDPTTGCASAPCSQTIAFTPCNTSSGNCPRNARFWRRQCGHEGDDGRLSDAQLASIASCVNSRAGLFAWVNPMVGFRSVMGERSMSALRARAWRQFAAVEANVCANSMSMTVGGMSIGVDPATNVSLDGGSITVGNWIAATDASLMSLAKQSQHSERVKASYRRIIAAGWSINHGHGMGPVCVAPPTQATHRPVGPISTDGADATFATTDEDVLEPLALELADDESDTFSIDFVGPNPFSSSTRIAYVLASGSAQSVMIGVYDINGRLVRDLVHASQTPGAYSIEWDGRDDHGLVARNGMYFVHGRVGAEPVQTRVTLLR